MDSDMTLGSNSGLDITMVLLAAEVTQIRMTQMAARPMVPTRPQVSAELLVVAGVMDLIPDPCSSHCRGY